MRLGKLHPSRESYVIPPEQHALFGDGRAG